MDVIIARMAIDDLREVKRYYRRQADKEVADKVIKDIKNLITSLCTYPDRGNYVNELLERGIKKYREVHFNTYRIVYRVSDCVNVLLIADGRRDFETLLEERGLMV